MPLASSTGASRTVYILLVAFVALWASYAMLARFNLDLHGDMVENYAWGIGWQLGYYKHPPLFAWVSAAWFSIFPHANLAYYLLSAGNVALGIWAMWRISLRFLDGPQQVMLVAACMVLPPFTILALNYNATSAMIPLWALAFLFYLRVLERRTGLDAVLLGLLAGLSMLAKYHSVVLLLAILAHAVFDKSARQLLMTRLSILALATGALVVLPHLVWMVQNEFITVRYAAEQGPGDWWGTVVYAVRFYPAIVGYLAPAVLLLAVVGFVQRRRPLFSWRPVSNLSNSSDGRALLAACVLPAVLTSLLGIVLDARVSSLWSIPFFVFLPFPLVLAMTSGVTQRAQMRPLATSVAAVAALVLVAAPFERAQILKVGRSNAATPVEAIADATQQSWREMTTEPLEIVAGELNVFANGAAFYADDHPFAIQDQKLELTPWVSRAAIEDDGAAFICREAAEATCAASASALFGRVDEVRKFSVAAPKGAGNGQSWDMVLLVRRPD